MRLAMRPDAYPAEVDDGAYILTHHRTVRFTGASIARWIDRIVPHLDGSRTLDELTATLPAERREMVEKIVAALRDSGVVREIDTSEPPPLTAAELAEYAPEIGYVDYFRTGAAAAFARYRNGMTLVIGSGPLLLPLASAALWSGILRLRVALTDERVTDPEAIRRLRTAVRPRDPLQTWDLTDQRDLDEEAVNALLEGVSLVLHAAAGEKGQARARLLDRCCADAGVALAQIVCERDDVWLVPARHPGGRTSVAAASWAAAAPRLTAGPTARRATPSAPGAASAAPAAVPPATAAAAAFQLVHGAFRVLTGVEPPADRGRVTRISLDTLRCDDHTFLPHPFALPATAATESEFRDRMGEMARARRHAEKDFSRLAAACMDEKLGLFAFSDNDWAQVPLHVSEAVVADPVGLLSDSPAPRTVVGAGFTYRSARCQAALRALAHYAAAMVDPRRLLDPDGGPLVRPTADPAAALTAIRAEPMAAAVWGWPLDQPAPPALVPATAAFPALATASPPPAATAGIAAGYDWQAAVETGLLGHCRRLTLMELSAARRPFPRVDLVAARLDEIGARCRDLLADLGELPEVYDVTGSLGVPTFAFCLGEATVVYGTGLTVSSALADGLVQLVLAVQASRHGQPEYAPPAAIELPVSLRGDAVSTAVWPVLDIGSVAARLRRAGKRALAVPLDHDPTLTARIPYLVNVVIRGD